MLDRLVRDSARARPCSDKPDRADRRMREHDGRDQVVAQPAVGLAAEQRDPRAGGRRRSRPASARRAPSRRRSRRRPARSCSGTCRRTTRPRASSSTPAPLERRASAVPARGRWPRAACRRPETRRAVRQLERERRPAARAHCARHALGHDLDAGRAHRFSELLAEHRVERRSTRSPRTNEHGLAAERGEARRRAPPRCSRCRRSRRDAAARASKKPSEVMPSSAPGSGGTTGWPPVAITMCSAA